jgi:hypothetical protein
VIEHDASRNGLGGILLQQGRPIPYFSKALSDENLTKAYEKELMAVALVSQHWWPYLLGR